MNPVDVYGQLLFGRRIRLRVLLWVAHRGEVFNQSEAARGVDYSSSGEIAKELERLVELGMVRKFGRESRVGPQKYIRTDHPGWRIATAAREAVAAGLPAPADVRTQALPIRIVEGGESRSSKPSIRDGTSTGESFLGLE